MGSGAPCLSCRVERVECRVEREVESGERRVWGVVRLPGRLARPSERRRLISQRDQETRRIDLTLNTKPQNQPLRPCRRRRSHVERHIQRETCVCQGSNSTCPISQCTFETRSIDLTLNPRPSTRNPASDADHTWKDTFRGGRVLVKD